MRALLFGGLLFLASPIAVLAQDAGADPTPVPADNHPSVPGIDIGALVSGIVQGFQTVLQGWANDLPRVLLSAISGTVANLWDALWGSGANLLATPLELTLMFPPARQLGAALGPTVVSIGVLAVVLLGLRTMWSTMAGQHSFVADAIDGVLKGLLLASVGALIVGQAFMLVGLASDAIGRIDYRPSFDPQTAFSIGPSIALAIFTLVVLFVRGWGLFTRAAYRIVLLMFLAPFAPVASALWAIPQTKHYAVWYWRTFGGWLVGGFLAIGAVSLGVQLATVGNTNGILSLIYGVALIDMAKWLLSALSPSGGDMSVHHPFRLTAGAIVAPEVVAAEAAGAVAVAEAVDTAGALASGYGYD